MSAAEQLNPSDLVPSVGIDFMCEQRAAAMAKIEQAAALVADAVDMLHAAKISAPMIAVVDRCRRESSSSAWIWWSR